MRYQKAAFYRHSNSNKPCLTMLRQSDAANLIKPRARLCMRFLDGRTPIQALLYHVLEGSDWVMNYGYGRCGDVKFLHTQIYGIYPRIFKHSHYVLDIDATYKPNRYYILIVDTVDVTPLTQKIFVGFGFIQI